MWDWLDDAINFFFYESDDGSGGILGDVWEGVSGWDGAFSSWFGGDSSGTSDVDKPDTNLNKDKDTDNKSDDDAWYDFISDPDFLGTAITAMPALIGGLFGPDEQDQLDVTNDQAQQLIDIKRDEMTLEAQLAREKIEAELAAVDAAREAATKRSLAAANQMFSTASNEITKMQTDAIKGDPALLQRSREAQMQAASQTGQLGQQGAQGLAQSLQAPALARS